ncbi:hypothetical protein NHX12_015303, partial [Muraenolepis orangiensis]
MDRGHTLFGFGLLAGSGPGWVLLKASWAAHGYKGVRSEKKRERDLGNTEAAGSYLALDPSSYPVPDSRSLSSSKVLSADHMEQMTRTYNDIEVVTHLLAERDRDLELAARIGQSLLQRNRLLQERNEAVDEQLTQAIDQVHQLQHELAQKDELLRMVASASEESESDSSCSTPHPLLQRPLGAGVSAATAAATALGQLEALQGKMEELEEENQALRSEANHLKTETVCYEEKEQRLVNDCVKELRESNSQIVSLADDLSQKGEEVLRHQEEIAQLLTQIVELQHRVKELALEKEELRIHLQASKEAQRQLTAELNELTERNAECLGMLHESQEEIKDLRSKNNSTGGLRRHLSYGLYPMDSLAAEIEGTMRKELGVDEESAFQDQRTNQKRVFQTVRSVNTLTARASSSPIPGSGLSPLVMTAQPFQSARSGEQQPQQRPGQPGSPGGDHLTDAIHRLSLRRHNFLCERKFFQAERERERKMEAQRGAGPEDVDVDVDDEEGFTSLSSTGSGRSSYASNLSELSMVSGVFKTFLPEKLQIVKPMEGSLTLHHWQQLAQPNLATVLDPHPGVLTKGFRLLDHEPDRSVRTASTPLDGKERAQLPGSPLAAVGAASFRPVVRVDIGDPPPAPVTSAAAGPVQSEGETAAPVASTSVQHPGKCQSSTFSTYTVTTCRILHPNDITQVTSSTPVTPCRLNLGGDSSCFPPASGLAKLHHRPSAPAASADNFLASRPAELFLQDTAKSRGSIGGGVEHPDPVSVGLVERLCRLGLMDGLRRNQSLPAMMGAGAAARAPPPVHPTSLALPPPPWGDLKEQQQRRRGRL